MKKTQWSGSITMKIGKQSMFPHTWNAIDGANGFDFYKGACWYRKELIVETALAGNKVFIEFNGSNSVTDVYVNGQHFGQHRGGYSTFRFDITDVIEFGKKNTLAVKVDNTVVEMYILKWPILLSMVVFIVM